jgi:tetratricopeptide (TPR) repeat protein
VGRSSWSAGTAGPPCTLRRSRAAASAPSSPSNANQEEGLIDEALAEFEKAVTVRPGDDPRVSQASTELALLFWRRGDHERAKRLLRDVLRARPGDEEVGSVLATLERL